MRQTKPDRYDRDHQPGPEPGHHDPPWPMAVHFRSVILGQTSDVTTEAAGAVVLDSSLKRVVIDLLAGLRMGYPPASLSD